MPSPTWVPTQPSPGTQPTLGTLSVIPNPVKGGVAFIYPPFFAGTMDASLKIYSKSYVEVAGFEFGGMAWHPLQVALADRWGGRLNSGLYYVVFKSAKGRWISKMFILQ